MHGWGWKLGLYKDHIRLVCNSRGSGVEINLCLQSYNFGNCTSNRTVRSLWGKVPSPALRIQICWCSRCLRVNAAGLIPVPNTSKKKKIGRTFQTQAAFFKFWGPHPANPTVSSAPVSLGYTMSAVGNGGAQLCAEFGKTFRILEICQILG